MTKKRFELIPNLQGQVDIIDHVESEEKNAICIYNDLGVLPFTSASSLCDLLNALHEENVKLQARNKYLATKIQRERNSHIKQHEKWENEIQKENEHLKQQLTDCKEKKQQMKEFFMNSEPVIEQKKLQKVIYQTVINLIDEKIKYYEHKPFSASISNPMSVNFDEDVDRLARLSELEQLKKELEL